MFSERVLQVLAALVLAAIALGMTGVMISAMYANRGALPIVATMFGAVLLFGFMW